MSVQLDLAGLQGHRRSKLDTARAIDNLATHLFGKCVVCWTWKNRLANTHQVYTQCKSVEDGWIAHATGWIAFKRLLKFAPYEYCFKCGLPQKPLYLAQSHPAFKTGQKLECPMEDLVVHIIWVIRHEAGLWTRAVEQFSATGLKANMVLGDFAKWCNLGNSDKAFYNGLELAVWFWQQRDTGHI